MFGDTVRGHRRRLGLTQEELAAKTGVSVRSIGKIECGQVAVPRAATVRLLANGLGLTQQDREKLHAAAIGSIPGLDVPAQLPTDVVGFVGRAEQLDMLDAGLAAPDHGAVVVSVIAGAAGAGKTALAVHWAHRVRDRFTDGQLYADLRGFTVNGSVARPDEILGGFLNNLGVPPGRIQSDLNARASLYRSLLAGRRVLVVLDNARDPEQVRPLLPGSPGCHVVVTSRDRLAGLIATDAARLVPLGSLSAAAARELLVRRLGPARVASEPEAVAAIIARSGRLPLALVIAAARAATNPGVPLATLARALRTPGRTSPNPPRPVRRRAKRDRCARSEPG